jgi:hypothetical protein
VFVCHQSGVFLFDTVPAQPSSINVTTLSTNSILLQWIQEGYVTGYNVTVLNDNQYHVIVANQSAIITDLTFAGKFYTVALVAISGSAYGTTISDITGQTCN